MQYKDQIEVGQVYNYLTIIELPYSIKKGRYTDWLVKCKCQCGTIKDVRVRAIITGSTKSCGCYNKIVASKTMTEYNHKYPSCVLRHSLYNSWKGMKRKCYNTNSSDYLGEDYTVCDDWKENAYEFYLWGINNGWQKGFALSLKNGKFEYNKDNCYFQSKANIAKQNSNPTKAQQTCMERYGVKSPMQLTSVLEKQRTTFFEKYGRPFGYVTNNKEQNSIRDWLLDYCGVKFKTSTKILKGRHEIDLYNKELKLGIEYCGLYWHNELSREPRLRTYHYNKYKLCLDEGIRLLTIFSDEWLLRQEQVQGFLMSVLGKNKRIYGRLCEVKQISREDGQLFVNNNHIQYQAKVGIVYFGIYYKDELLGVMSLNKHHRINDQDIIVLDRMVFMSGISIVGGASKLLKKAIEWCKLNNYNTICTWSDNRWSVGNVYDKMGFVFDADLPPDYSYVKISAPKERIPKQRMKKSIIGCPVDIKEHEYCKELGYARIWDCGKKRYTLNVEAKNE